MFFAYWIFSAVVPRSLRRSIVDFDFVRNRSVVHYMYWIDYGWPQYNGHDHRGSMMMTTMDDDDDGWWWWWWCWVLAESQFPCDNAESVSVVFGMEDDARGMRFQHHQTIMMNIFFPLVFISSYFFFSTVEMASSTSSKTIRQSVSFEGFHFACEWNSRFAFFFGLWWIHLNLWGKWNEKDGEKNAVSKIFAHPLLPWTAHELVIIANGASLLCVWAKVFNSNQSMGQCRLHICVSRSDHWQIVMTKATK